MSLLSAQIFCEPQSNQSMNIFKIKMCLIFWQGYITASLKKIFVEKINQNFSTLTSLLSTNR